MDNDNNENAENNEEGQEWGEPPLPEEIGKENAEEPQMSEVSTLFGIFLEPGKTFDDLRRKPRFLMAGAIIVILSSLFAIGLQQKLGEEAVRRSITVQNEKNPQFESMDADQKKTAIDLGVTITKVTSYVSPILVIFVLLIGGLPYWLGAKVMGSEGSYLAGLSVYLYSSVPMVVIGVILNFLVLFLKSADEIDFASSQRGLINANALAFFDGSSMPVLATIISFVDLFAIWGWILAAIGMQRVMKLSKGSAWGVVLFFALLGFAGRVIGALLSGNPS